MNIDDIKHRYRVKNVIEQQVKQSKYERFWMTRKRILNGRIAYGHYTRRSCQQLFTNCISMLNDTVKYIIRKTYAYTIDWYDNVVFPSLRVENLVETDLRFPVSIIMVTYFYWNIYCISNSFEFKYKVRIITRIWYLRNLYIYDWRLPSRMSIYCNRKNKNIFSHR
jgi:hypothetical protein